MVEQRFSEVIAGGDDIASLTALRDLLAKQIEVCDSARDVAALSQRLLDVLERIRAGGGAVKPDDPEDSTFDELARRRSARGSDPAGVERTGRV